MLPCGTPDKTVAVQLDRHLSINYKTLKMTITEVISQQRGRRTDYTNSF